MNSGGRYATPQPRFIKITYEKLFNLFDFYLTFSKNSTFVKNSFSGVVFKKRKRILKIVNEICKILLFVKQFLVKN